MKSYIFLIGILLAVILVLGCTGGSESKTTVVDTTKQPTAENKTIQPIPVQEIKTEPVRGSAKDWFEVAKLEATKWRTDSQLVEVEGTNKLLNGSATLPIDGLAERWTYTFLSKTLLKRYVIVVEFGEITSTSAYDESLVARYAYAPDISKWVINSDSAVNTVNTKAKGNDFIKDNPGAQADYLLRFEGVNEPSIYWTISYFPKFMGTQLSEKVDGERGTII
jgi:hypothetical protein